MDKAVDTTEARLAKCFLAAFPELKLEEAPRATTANLQNWDSVASVTLFTLIEEEFGPVLKIDALDDFSSFERILAKIQVAEN